jgi:F-type H+-transporting ATPase subunit alpha
LVETAGGLAGLVLDVGPTDIGVLFLDPADDVVAGASLYLTGRVATTVVGDELLGRIVDPLGRPLDGGPPLRSEIRSPIERDAPGVAKRLPVQEPLHTGITLIDALLPLGRGQRELILGDRATGKTSIALDTMLAQRATNVLCVYAAIGKRAADVGEVADTLLRHGVSAQTIVVAADADTPAGQQYLAPFAACTMAEYFVAQGRHVLVVYDDLTKHADAYRRISLLLDRAPGREAYPSDIFYLHARLLERATRLRENLGGGSMTALPIAETEVGTMTAYIPTNLISITDGQLYCEPKLFNEGVRPPIDVGLSVSRVGGRAQPAILRQLAGDLRLLYAQIPELESLVRFGAELEATTRQILDRGQRLREVLKQRRMAPLRLAHQVAALMALQEGYLDPIPVERVGTVVQALQRRLDAVAPELLTAIDEHGELTEVDAERLRRTIEAVQRASADAEEP